MNQPVSSHPHTAHAARKHKRSHTVRRVLGVTALLCVAVGGVSFLLSRPGAAPAASAASAASLSTASVGGAVPGGEAENSGLLTAAQAQAMLADPRMVLVNHTNKMPDDYTFTTKECGSSTAINKTLQTEAADAFLAMQAAAAKDGVTIWMQSGYRSVDYQTNLYNKKTQYYRDKGLSEAEARKKAATIVNPPGYSEHNCGLAADLNSPEHTTLDTGFENTAAFRWLCAHAEQYGFILRYPKDAEAVTEITYEPWHWRYVGPENAALINQSGLCLEDAVYALQLLASGQPLPSMDTNTDTD